MGWASKLEDDEERPLDGGWAAGKQVTGSENPDIGTYEASAADQADYRRIERERREQAEREARWQEKKREAAKDARLVQRERSLQQRDIPILGSVGKALLEAQERARRKAA